MVRPCAFRQGRWCRLVGRGPGGLATADRTVCNRRTARSRFDLIYIMSSRKLGRDNPNGQTPRSSKTHWSRNNGAVPCRAPSIAPIACGPPGVPRLALALFFLLCMLAWMFMPQHKLILHQATLPSARRRVLHQSTWRPSLWMASHSTPNLPPSARWYSRLMC